MIKRIIHILFAPIGGALGYSLWLLLESPFRVCEIELWGWARVFFQIALISIVAVVGYFVGKPVSKLVEQLLSRATKKAREMPGTELIATTVGLLVGFLCAFLVCQVFVKISSEILVTCINALIYICFGFLGARVAFLRNDDFKAIFRRKKEDDTVEVKSGGTVLDSSILIDGRTVDIYKTGFIAEPVYIPTFVLDELTRLADSEEPKKRTRGRIGLDTVKQLR